MLLTTRGGQCIRFPVDDVRVFKGRDFDRRARHHAGRGRQASSRMAILRHVDATADERAAYLKQRRAARRAARRRGSEDEPDADDEEVGEASASSLEPSAIAATAARPSSSS